MIWCEVCLELGRVKRKPGAVRTCFCVYASLPGVRDGVAGIVLLRYSTCSSSTSMSHIPFHVHVTIMQREKVKTSTDS